MALELILLGALIFIFIVSFCGLLRKIRQTYERERILAERLRNRQQTQRINSEIEDFSVFPASVAPPPYSRQCMDQPPKYEEVVKVHREATRVEENMPDNPPPYTIM